MHGLGAIGAIDAADVVGGAGGHDADAVHLGAHHDVVPRLLALGRGRPPVLENARRCEGYVLHAHIMGGIGV